MDKLNQCFPTEVSQNIAGHKHIIAMKLRENIANLSKKLNISRRKENIAR